MTTTLQTPPTVVPAPRGAARLQRRIDRDRTASVMLGGSRVARWVALIALILFSLLWILPMVWAILTSLKSEADASAVPLQILPEHGFTLSAYSQVLSAGGLPRWLFNSVITAVVITALTVAICALAAYALSRLDFKGQKLLTALTLASIMIPAQILIVPLFREMLSLRLVDTLWGIILPQLIVPVNVFILKRFFDGVPQELEEAGRIDGASSLRVMWSIILPLSRPILVAVAIFTFIGAWNNFLWPFIVVNDPNLMTMPVGIATVKNAYGVQYAQTMASAVIAAAPLLIIFTFFQRQIVKGIATTGIAGQ
ncbi:carbohydrate ABC transporter permease [Lapillicoccus sp.]|uniref:carbohydrate ABC transporter permease n=1 Tax=Lapillicoccus sp. TaxID=1909287 RepID=UPI003267CB3F